jgi:hypothetical protein
VAGALTDSEASCGEGTRLTFLRAILDGIYEEARVANLESAKSDTDASPQEHRKGIDGPPNRPWWRSRVGAAAGAAVVAVIGLVGYFGIHAMLAHPSSPATAPSASDIDDPVPGLPPGALPCTSIQTNVGLFNAGARGTPATTCEFVEQVSMAYSKHTPTPGPDLLTVLSPATSKSYHLVCLSMGGYATCTGGAAAVIYLYNK